MATVSVTVSECVYVIKLFSVGVMCVSQAFSEVVSSCACYSSGFLLGFLGLRERLLALQRGQIGAFRWICWWQDRQAWKETTNEINLFYFIHSVYV